MQNVPGQSDATLGRTYFDRLYEDADDPWSFRTSAYEAEKYDRTIATLERRYARGLEIGCSVGILTRRFAEHVDALLALDISERAVAQARETCADRRNVTVAQSDVTCDFPGGAFDLVIVSEVAYYWSEDDFARVRERIAAGAPGGDVLLVHFLPKVPDYVLDGDAVHEAFLTDPRYQFVRGSRAERYRIDLLRVCS